MNVRDPSFDIDKMPETSDEAARFAQVWKADFTSVPANPRRALCPATPQCRRGIPKGIAGFSRKYQNRLETGQTFVE